MFTHRANHILILTEPTDPHADHVAEKLHQRGVDFVRFNPAQFPAATEVTLAYPHANAFRATLRLGDTAIELDQLTSVWNRRPEPPRAPAEITNPAAREYAQAESATFLQDVWGALDCFWLPARPSVIQRAQLKASQLQVAGALGFELPPTLITNSPDEFLDFYQRHKGNVVSKLAGFSFFRAFGNDFSRYTEIVSKRDLGYAASIRYCPVIFQAYVPKRLELRITVVGRSVFAAEIHSQVSNHTRHDWRRYDLYQTPHLPHDLPAEISERCVRLVERLGLAYGAIDMALTPDGRYVFLEINPNGQYLWIEEMTGLPISDAICDLLIAGGSPAVPTAIPLAQKGA